MTTRLTDGGAALVIDGGMEALIRRCLTAAQTETVASLEAGAEQVAEASRASWYGSDGVTRETGLSGDIEVVTTFDAGRGKVTVSVGSTDTRKAGKAGKPLVAFVHRPKALSLVKKQVTNAEYWGTPEKQRANYKPVKGDTGAGPFVWVVNPKASDGKFLLAEYVRKPMKLRAKQLVTEAVKKIAARANGGSGG